MRSPLARLLAALALAVALSGCVLPGMGPLDANVEPATSAYPAP